jgi:hypothetical protein
MLFYVKMSNSKSKNFFKIFKNKQKTSDLFKYLANKIYYKNIFNKYFLNRFKKNNLLPFFFFDKHNKKKYIKEIKKQKKNIFYNLKSLSNYFRILGSRVIKKFKSEHYLNNSRNINTKNFNKFSKILKIKRKILNKKLWFHRNRPRKFLYRAKCLIYKYLYTFLKKFMYNPQVIFLIENKKKGTLSSQFLVEAVLVKLHQGYRINVILKALMRVAKAFGRRYRIRAMRVIVAGRFTRRDRSVYKIRKRGGIPLNTVYAPVDYSLGLIAMRYSVCVCKI